MSFLINWLLQVRKYITLLFKLRRLSVCQLLLLSIITFLLSLLAHPLFMFFLLSVACSQALRPLSLSSQCNTVYKKDSRLYIIESIRQRTCSISTTYVFLPLHLLRPSPPPRSVDISTSSASPVFVSSIFLQYLLFSSLYNLSDVSTSPPLTCLELATLCQLNFLQCTLLPLYNSILPSPQFSYCGPCLHILSPQLHHSL
jgi:hypothetical protein